LIGAGAKIEFKDDLGCTPLHLACKKGCYEAVQMLLDNQANIYVRDKRDWTPLHYASYNGHPKICKQLLTFSVDEDPKLRDAKNS
jgi:ankyrin repeat protein